MSLGNKLGRCQRQFFSQTAWQRKSSDEHLVHLILRAYWRNSRACGANLPQLSFLREGDAVRLARSPVLQAKITFEIFFGHEMRAGSLVTKLVFGEPVVEKLLGHRILTRKRRSCAWGLGA